MTAQSRRECGTKARYTTRADADAAILAIWERGSERTSIRAYRCSHCGTYHLTSQPARAAQGRA